MIDRVIVDYAYNSRLIQNLLKRVTKPTKLLSNSSIKLLHKNLKTIVKLKPRKDQIQAITEIVQNFQNFDRGKFISPCGSGKTFTTLQVKEAMNAEKTLVVVPFKNLVRQTQQEWENQATKPFDHICVSSIYDIANVDKDIKGNKRRSNNLYREDSNEIDDYSNDNDWENLIGDISDDDDEYDPDLDDDSDFYEYSLSNKIDDDDDSPSKYRFNESRHNSSFFRNSFRERDSMDDGYHYEESIFKRFANRRADKSVSVEQIESFLERDDDQVVYTTYDSLFKVIEAVRNLRDRGIDFKFDLGVFDEAHMTAPRTKKTMGEISERSFPIVHDANLLPCAKRLYVTATPRTFVVNDTDEENEANEIIDMDNEAIFGPTFFKLSFADAIDKGISTDYKILLMGTTKDELQEYLKTTGIETSEPEKYINNVILYKAMKKYGLGHTICFHNRIKRSENFVANFQSMFPEINSWHIDHSTSDDDWLGIKNNFFASQRDIGAVLSNCGCLNAGLDLPKIDSVFYSDKKSSTEDIFQTAGRSLRQDETNPDKVAFLIIPLYLESLTNLGFDINSKHKLLFRALLAMGLHDESLINNISAKVITDTGNLKFDSQINRWINMMVKPQLQKISMKDLKDAVEKIRNLQTTLPGSLEIFFNTIMPRVLRFGFPYLISLAKKDKMFESDPSYLDMAKKIWPEIFDTIKNFANIKTNILTKQKLRPADLSQYFNFQILKDIGISYSILVSILKSEDLIDKNTRVNFACVADLIWGKTNISNLGVVKRIAPEILESIKNFSTIKTNILAKQKLRPEYPSQYFNFQIEKDIGISFSTLVAIAKLDGLIDRSVRIPSFISVADLIWGRPDASDIVNFDIAKSKILNKQQQRPNDAFDYFREAIVSHIGIDKKTIVDLAVTANLCVSNISDKELSNLIWGLRK